MFLVISSYIADLLLGDPEWFPHPVRGVGRLVSLLDNRLGAKACKWVERINGMVLAFSVIGITFIVAYLSLELLRKVNPLLGSLSLVYLGYTTLSIKDLRDKAKAILKELENNSIIGARRQLSKIVGRDTQDLNQERIIKATIESIAENTNDGIIAPLFYLVLGGPILAIIYKAINTLDSMVGYKNERYIYFGWFSAKLDDVVNFIPARITAILISLSSLILGKDFKDSFKTMLRDGRRHPSLNSGFSEAAMAGALGIRLGGHSYYQGKILAKPYLGEEKREAKPSCIDEALAISLVTSIVMVSIGILLKWAV